MCTSFMFRGDDTLIAMNYDNSGKNLKLSPYNPELFLVTINSNGKDRPLFGVRNDGVMVNQQVVNECESGKYRIGYHTVHTAQLLKRILTKKLPVSNLDRYIATHKVVNPPKYSLHMLIASADGNSYIIEPGRGHVQYPYDERSIILSNCSICDAKKTGELQGFGVDRQLIVEDTLKKAPNSFRVSDAFKLLEKVHQTDELWTTEFSFVYSHNENKVYYCYDHEYTNIKEYQLK